MIIERIIFNVFAFVLFFIIFLKMVQKNDTNYIYILLIEAIGIAIGFIGLIFRINLPMVIIIFTYVISIILPIVIIILEKKALYLSEIIYLNIAKFQHKKGDFEKAKNILMELAQKYPNSYLVHKELALVCEKQENKDIAIDEYIRASDLNEANYELKIKAANLLKNTTRKEEAIGMLTQLLKIKPDCYEASIILGDILYEKENYKEAINVYLQALNYNPDKYELYYNLGMLYTNINDFQSAKEYYEKAAEINSILYNAKFDLAQISLLYNELEEAETYLMECINDDSIVDEAYYYLAYISMLKGDKEKGLQFLTTAVEENEELYEKASKEPVFSMIINKIKRPTNTAKDRKKISKKEKIVMQHLEETCAVVGNLSNNDIKVIRKLRKKEENEKEL